VFAKRHAAIFVHGCFWHRHNCGHGYTPKTRRKFWQTKFRENIRRDRAQMAELRKDGWRLLVIWECQIHRTGLAERLAKFLDSRSN
jgi:DNA mismatch endonuclease (patch repair protein)